MANKTIDGDELIRWLISEEQALTRQADTESGVRRAWLMGEAFAFREVYTKVLAMQKERTVNDGEG